MAADAGAGAARKDVRLRLCEAWIGLAHASPRLRPALLCLVRAAPSPLGPAAAYKCTQPCGRFEEPLPRDDGTYVPGNRVFKLSGNLWALNPYYGTLVKIPGAPNLSMEKPIAEHVKNVLRGRQAFGLTHGLTRKWAQLPKGKRELSATASLPARNVKRARPGPVAPGDAVPRMGSLE